AVAAAPQWLKKFQRGLRNTPGHLQDHDLLPRNTGIRDLLAPRQRINGAVFDKVLSVSVRQPKADVSDFGHLMEWSNSRKREFDCVSGDPESRVPARGSGCPLSRARTECGSTTS